MSRNMVANGTIRRARFVKIDPADNNSVLECGAGELACGISQFGSRAAPIPSETADPPQAAQAGESLVVHDMNTARQDLSVEVGIGGVTAGDPIVSDSQGRAVLGFGVVNAYALESASAGELVNVILVSQMNSGVPYIPYVFDADGTNGDTDQHTLIPGVLNKTGMVVLHVIGLIREVMAGSSQDQGIVTVKDDSGNTIATLTPSDAAADALNDVVAGYNAFAASTGAAGKYVAAGDGLYGYVSQATSGGTPAGKIQVVVIAHLLTA